MMSLLRRRMMMATLEGEEEMKEYVCNDFLYEYVIPVNTEAQTIDTGINWGTLKTYRRFTITIHGTSNTALQNAYLLIGSYSIGRFSTSGYSVTFIKIGDNLYESYYYSSNSSLVRKPGVDAVGNVITGVTMNFAGVLGDLANHISTEVCEDTDTVKFLLPSTATIEYTIRIAGLTK